MDDLQVKQLMQRYLDGQCSAEETALLESWYLKQSTAFERPNVEMIDRNEQLMMNFVEGRMAEIKTVVMWPRIAVVAASFFIVIGAYFFKATLTNNVDRNPKLAAADIAAGKNGATLILANGQKIFIHDALTGNIASQSGVKISKTKDGQILYEVTNQGTDKIEYNTLTTTRGEQTRVRLPDGSLVFLNAASSLKYPTNFAKATKRSVELTGEGYFEISKNKMQPFVVTAANQQVEVLGTHFNINAYQDEPATTTTLEEGAVKVTSGKNQKVIRPGEQVQNIKDSLSVTKVNLETVMDWKNGDFNLMGIDFKLAMRKIARWYDVEMIYDSSMPKNIQTDGWISRRQSLKSVLEMIEKLGVVKFRLEGRKVFVIAQAINSEKL